MKSLQPNDGQVWNSCWAEHQNRNKNLAPNSYQENTAEDQEDVKELKSKVTLGTQKYQKVVELKTNKQKKKLMIMIEK